MSDGDLHRALARATGEFVQSIQKIGFHLLSEEEPADDVDPLVIDWDAGRPNTLSRVVADDDWPERQEPIRSWDEDASSEEEFDCAAA